MDSFEGALEAFASIVAADAADDTVDPRCLPLLLHHGARVERAVVLLHGFTNCPRQFAEFATLLFQTGYNVYVPRLPRHGLADKRTTLLDAITLAELITAATDAVAIAAGLAGGVDVLGLSLGGTMAAWLAQTQTLERAIAISPFFSVSHVGSAFEPLFAGALESAPNADLWWDPRLRERTPPAHAYPRFGTHALGRCLEFGAAVRDLARTTAPRTDRSTLVLNIHDPAIDNAAAIDVWKLWRDRGASSADEYVFRNLDRRHDIIEPVTYPQARTLVYPVLAGLLRDR